MIFLDTSVLIPIVQVSHVHYRPSRDLWKLLVRKEVTISSHALAETYATLTSMRPGLRVSPVDAVSTIEMFLTKLTPISLSPEEYLETIRAAARLGLSDGMIYDAVHLACARKANADRIYTWNLKHFRAIAPDLAARIMTP